jgi:hypothetical protein
MIKCRSCLGTLGPHAAAILSPNTDSDRPRLQAQAGSSTGRAGAAQNASAQSSSGPDSTVGLSRPGLRSQYDSSYGETGPSDWVSLVPRCPSLGP